ncbi:hypothetical protein EDD15DRAFT_2196016 [Pisolithus albus]|nr:hypothetical protein EDD15DRAFT_2196016 [Pisolithus albus]
MASDADALESTTRYICSCSKYNFGRPHPVSKATFYRHINEADTDEEKERLRATKTREGFDLGRQAAPTVGRRAAILQAMAKRRGETVEDPRQHVGRRKRARGPDIDSCTHESDQPETDPSPPDDEEMSPLVPDTPDGPTHDDSLPLTPDPSDAEIHTVHDVMYTIHLAQSDISRMKSQPFSVWTTIQPQRSKPSRPVPCAPPVYNASAGHALSSI